MDKLEKRLELTISWLLKSRSEQGGSSARFSLYNGWSKPYPETTGYIIPTLLKYYQKEEYKLCFETAFNFGEWLLDIQNSKGFWSGGLYTSHNNEAPSVFNTGQILFGIVALYKVEYDEKWLNAALNAATWLAKNVNSDGLWNVGHYNNFNPTYYTRVAWPMLLVAQTFDVPFVKKQAIKVLDTLMQRKADAGSFRGWGFKQDKPAFTHTIAYTIRGFMEASFLLNDWERYGAKVEPAMEKFYRLAELRAGRLSGTYGEDWQFRTYYSCLTGNVQLALCLMRWHQYKNDLRLINAASKLINYVNKCQKKTSLIPSLKGAIAGSSPFFGGYMRFRYPNWAAKFHADALMLLLELLNKEMESCQDIKELS